jgi:hypothetical protein
MRKQRTCLRSLVALMLLLYFLFSAANAQDNKPSPTPSPLLEQKSEQIIKRAIEVLGGNNYLKVRTVTGRGYYTQYKDGMSQLPAKFVDYLIYPDKERTEFAGGGTHVIQVNAGDGGWIFDGASKNLKDQKPEQIEDFKFGLRTSLENLLRGSWPKDGAKLSYVGRREAGLAKRNETIRLTYPSGFWIEYEFGAKDGLPAKIIYLRKRKNFDSGEIEEATEEDRLAKPITIDGITAPWVIDHFIAGKQSSRITYESIEYNRPISDSLFTKPATIKGLK